MPNRFKFTQAAVVNLKPPATGRVTFWDSQFAGFGLRVSAPRPGSRDGRKTWVAMGRVGGKSVMETIGTLSQIPKVEQAREAARIAIGKMRTGTSPLAERRAEHEQKLAEAAAAEAAAAEAVEGRFDAVAERFLAELAANCSARYAYEVRRIFAHDILPRWADRPIRSISKNDVNQLLDAKAQTRERPHKRESGGAGIQANRTLIRLRTLFAWAMARDLVSADPCAGVMARGKERARDRVLDDSEIICFWHGATGLGWPYGPIFKLLLLTAQREAEVTGMRWGEIDLETRVWTLPSGRTKSARRHVVHLSDPACEILSGLPHLGDSDLVFPARTGVPVSDFSRQKVRLDLVMAGLRAAAGKPAIGDWVFHDLRRTATTLMARIGVMPHVADRVLNHSSGVIRGVAATYNRFQYLNERRAALEALGSFVQSLVRPGTNVVPLRVGA